jgi:diaminopimelate epimerase
MEFMKYQGTGNDFLIVKEQADVDYSALAVQMCDRHFGIGADGLIYPSSSEVADIKMNFYNADGSIAAMCGNGIRCFGKYLIDNGIIENDPMTIETLAGIKTLVQVDDDFIKVDMGERSLESKDIVNFYADQLINKKIFIHDREFDISTILFGVPHTIIFVENFDLELIEKYGHLIETHDLFTEGTNVNFVKVIDDENINVMTWERGVGRTLSCGTGVCASTIVANHLEKVKTKVNVKVLGGNLGVELIDDQVYLLGEAKAICQGNYFGG